MTYIDEVYAAVKAEIPDIDPLLLPLYALLAMCSHGYADMEEVHDAWAIWRHQTQPDHRSLVPFSELSDEVAMLDYIYMMKINRIAKALKDAKAKG